MPAPGMSCKYRHWNRDQIFKDELGPQCEIQELNKNALALRILPPRTILVSKFLQCSEVTHTGLAKESSAAYRARTLSCAVANSLLHPRIVLCLEIRRRFGQS